MSTANMIVVTGRAQRIHAHILHAVLEQLTVRAHETQQAGRRGANRTTPSAAPDATMAMHAQVNMLLAVASSLRPRLCEMSTDEPTPIRSAIEKLMMTNGIARLTAAKAVSPRNCPTIMPSSS